MRLGIGMIPSAPDGYPSRGAGHRSHAANTKAMNTALNVVRSGCYRSAAAPSRREQGWYGQERYNLRDQGIWNACPDPDHTAPVGTRRRQSERRPILYMDAGSDPAAIRRESSGFGGLSGVAAPG